MPVTKSAKKSLRQDKKRTLKNLGEKRKIKDLFKKTLKALEANETDKVKDLMRQFQKAIDKAVKHGWLKRNTGDRKKSRLAARVRKVGKK